MQSLTKFFLMFMMAFGLFAAQQYDVSLEKKSNYNGWGTDWDSVYVLKNDLITLAAVPKIGGRVMQYDLGTHPSIYIHEPSKGLPVTNGNAMIGGYRMLPSPQSDFGWPSPPKVDFAEYTCTVLQNNADSAVISMLSPIEDSEDSKYTTHQGLQFRKMITLYKASSHVKVEMTMLNRGQQSFTHGIWDITQSTCTNNDAVDTTNFWVYFQRNASSELGGGKGYVQYDHEGTGGDSQWKPDAAPGNIMGVQYKQLTGKIGADCKAGWICFIDRLDGYAYVKTFTHKEAATYPDSGASVQVYTYSNYNMLEVEVLGPLFTFRANQNDTINLVEDWYAARSLGPVLAVNAAGLITNKLTGLRSSDTLSVKGTFGVFYQGMVKFHFCDASNNVISVADSIDVTPTDSLVVNNKLYIPSDATMLQLAAFDNSGSLIGILDTLTSLTTSSLPGKQAIVPSGKAFTAVQKNNAIEVTIPYHGTFRVTILTADGRLISSSELNAPRAFTKKMNAIPNGVLIVNVSGKKGTESRKLLYSRKN